LILVDIEGTGLRLRHDEIEERFTSSLSPMPNAAEKTVDEADFSHLVEYLLRATEPPEESSPAE